MKTREIKYGLLTIALFFHGLLAAQITVKGKLINLPPNSEAKIAWDNWVTDNWKQRDSLHLRADGSFEKQISIMGGQARLRVWGKPTSWNEFVVPVNPGKPLLLDFGTVDFNALNGSPLSLEDPENKAYASLMWIVRDMRSAKDSLDRKQPPADGDVKGLGSRYQQHRLRLNERCLEVSKSLLGTFTADIVCRMLYQVLPEPDPRHRGDLQWANLYMKQHALDLIPFADRRILSHNSCMRSLIQYQNDYFLTDTAGRKAAIDGIMARRSGQAEVDEWLFRFLWERSMSRKDDYAISYLISSYAASCAEEGNAMDSNFKGLLEAFQNCEIGKPGADIQVNGTDGKTIRLSSLYSKSKLNLLLFWRSDCSHCKEYEPILEELYQRFHPMGMEVIAISLDQDPAKWKAALAEAPRPWLNVTTTPEQRKILNKNYPIPGTPTVIAMDGKGIILNRMMYRAGVEQFLEDTLRELNAAK